MTTDPIVNFGKVIVSLPYDNTAQSIILQSGNGSKLPDPSSSGAFNLVWWNYTDYPDPSDDPYVEIVRCTARSTDTLTVSRAQEGTLSSNKNTSGKTYKMILAPTKKIINDLDVVSGSLSTGGVLFVNSSGKIVQDNLNFFWDSTNTNLGIGTTVPFSGLSSRHGLDIVGSGTYQSLLLNNAGTGGNAWELISANNSDTNISGKLAFISNNALQAVLTSDTKFGIGTTSPQTTLDVNGNIRLSGNDLLMSGSAGSRIRAPSGYGTLSNSTASAVFLAWGNDLTGSTATVNINSSGNVGIGTVSPSTALEIANNGIIRASNSSNYVQIVGGSNDTQLELNNATTGGLHFILDCTGNSTGTGAGGGKLLFFTGTNYSHFVLDGNNQRVGIGTAFPGSQLEIGTNAAITGRRLRLLGYAAIAGTDANLEIGDGGTIFWRMARDNTNNFRTDMSGTWSIMGGNFGIATTTPNAPLDVKGVVRIGADLTSGDKLILSGETGGTNSHIFTQGTGSTYINWYGGTGGIIFGNGASGEIARVTSSGNVCIGTTSPSLGLSVENGTQGNPAISGTAQNGALRLRAGSNVVLDFGMQSTGWIGSWIQSADRTGLNTNYILALNPNGGNVGIGTTSPNSALDVVGTLKIGTGTVRGATFASSYGDNFQLYTYTNTPNPNWNIGYGNGAGALDTTREYISSMGGSIYFINANVGIGTSTPSQPLEISKTGASTYMLIRSDSDKEGGIFFTDPSSTRGDKWLWEIFKASTTPDLKIWNNNVGNTFTIQNGTGYVGISTPSPGSKLDIHVNSTETTYPWGAGLLRVTNENTNNGIFSSVDFIHGTSINGSIALQKVSGNASDFVLWSNNGTSLSEKMRLTSSGRLGIGTTSPVGIIHTSSTSDNNNNYFEAATTGFISNIILRNAGINKWFLSSRGSADSPNDRLGIFNAGGTSEVMTILQNGNVGIGTASPSATFHVNGSVLMYADVDGSAIMIQADFTKVPYYSTGVPTNAILQAAANRTGVIAARNGTSASYVYEGFDASSTPVRTFYVTGQGNMGLSGSISSNSSITSNGQIQLSNNNLIMQNSAAIGQIISKRNAANTGSGIQVLTQSSTNADTTRLDISSGVDTATFNILNSNVGIGTSATSQRLTLSGNMSVSGQYAASKYTTTTTLDWNNGNVQYIVLANGAQTFTFTNPIDGGRYMLILKQPGSGAAGTITWPGTVTWPGGTAPTLTTANGKVDIITLIYDATNSKYYSGYSQNY